jgi:hypothetical protein
MLRRIALFSILFSSLALACGDKGAGGDGEGSGDGDGDGDTATGDTGDETDGGDGDAACDQFLLCVDKVDTEEVYQMYLDKYGEGGTCWAEETPEECIDDCMDFMDAYKDDNPNALECGGDPLCPGQCCEKDTACNPDFPCCGDEVCFLEGATQCLCLNLPERCNTCMTDCLATMMPPEQCEAACKTWCVPDLSMDPINCRSWD